MSPFEAELHAVGRRRVRLSDLRAAFLRAHPEMLGAPNLRELLLDALRDLQRESIVDLPARGWDESGNPALPRTALILDAPSRRQSRSAHAWLPALAFAADERHPVRRADLQAINAYLLSSRGRPMRSVPTRERSLQIFGDEKRLDEIRKGERTLYRGRVSLDDLHCHPVAPPVPAESPGGVAAGRPILVLENYHSYDSFRRWNRKVAQYAAVAYGGGNAFRQGADNLDELIATLDAGGAVYVGDLDPAGVEILLGVNERRRARHRPLVQPHRGLYEWLLEHGCRRPLEKPPRKDLASRLAVLFPSGIAAELSKLWSAEKRIPQESFGLEQLCGREAAVARHEAA